MWPDLRKATFHTYNIKIHFSPSNNSCTHWLTIQAGIDAESCVGCFCCGLFLRPVRCPRVLGSSSNGYISPWQADSRLYFTTRLADEFGYGFSCFVWYVMVKMAPMDAIWLVLVRRSLCQLLCSYPPTPTLPSYSSVTGIGYASKKII